MILPLILLGCSGKDPVKWNATDISGVMEPLTFNLTDDQGKSVTGKDYRGKVVMLYFGYTFCPDICPQTLTRLAASLMALGNQAEKVKVLFVSVDPNRDTPKVLREYVKYFSPQMLGLTGTQSQLKDVTKRYRVAYSYGKGYPDKKTFYVVNHSASIYMFDPKGDARLLIDQQETSAQITADLKQLITQSWPGQ
ncbi:MAG: cytochrome c oxidase assembly protein [Halothiobacillus sp. 20-54-6]|nr:MAG: cytochrome c oxidase assembly protein [Halothiobacillus sp. 20-54-6]